MQSFKKSYLELFDIKYISNEYEYSSNSNVIVFNHRADGCKMIRQKILHKVQTKMQHIHVV